jgi:hypothetical protein
MTMVMIKPAFGRNEMAALASARLIVPISPDDKKIVEEKAAAGNMSAAELARRAVLDYDPREEARQEEAELQAQLEIFKAVHAETLAQLDRTDAALDAALAYFEAKSRR